MDTQWGGIKMESLLHYHWVDNSHGCHLTILTFSISVSHLSVMTHYKETKAAKICCKEQMKSHLGFRLLCWPYFVSAMTLWFCLIIYVQCRKCSLQ